MEKAICKQLEIKILIYLKKYLLFILSILISFTSISQSVVNHKDNELISLLKGKDKLIDLVLDNQDKYHLQINFTKVDANGASKTYDCGVANCSLFIYRDHRGITDTALDTIVPLKFLPRQTVAVAKLGLKRDGASYKAGDSVSISADKLKTSKGQAIFVTSDETRSICTTTGTTSFTIKFRKPGKCQVTLFAEGSAKLDQMIEVLTYIVK